MRAGRWLNALNPDARSGSAGISQRLATIQFTRKTWPCCKLDTNWHQAAIRGEIRVISGSSVELTPVQELLTATGGTDGLVNRTPKSISPQPRHRDNTT